REALSRLTGASQAIPAMEGKISDRPIPALFVELLRNKSTGTLTLQHEQSKRAVTFQQGMVRFAQSNLRQETVGAAQIASGMIKQTSFDRAVALAKQQGIALHEALAAARVMTPEQLKVALKQQTAEVAVAAVGMTAGTCRFEQKPIEAVSTFPDMRTSPVNPVAAEAAAADQDRAKVFTAEEHTARKMLFGERDHLRDASHYEILGVPANAQADAIKQAYFGAAKRFHSDAFSGMELGSARKAAEDLFAKVNEAHSVLTDKEKRAEYDVFLDRKSKGLPTDVAAILRAEGVFQKGELFFKSGRWEDAENQFREAISLNHTEAEFHAYLGMAIFKRTGKPEQAVKPLEKALELDPRLHSGILFLTQVLETQGEVERAKSLLRKAIDKDPEFAKAKDELRRLKNRPVEQAKGGFLSRLLKK